MTYNYAYDGPPTKCASGPKVGTINLRDGVMAKFGCGDQGIFNCRPIRVHDHNGNQVNTLSFHADGRAWDAQCTSTLNHEIAAWLVEHADTLGIQEVISYNRRWDSRDRNWHVYEGDDDHTTHVHTSQCKAAALNLTLADVQAIPRHQEEDVTPQDKKDIIDAVNAHVDARVNQVANDLAASDAARLKTAKDEILAAIRAK